MKTERAQPGRREKERMGGAGDSKQSTRERANGENG